MFALIWSSGLIRWVMVNTMAKKQSKRGRPSRGRGGERYAVNLRAAMRGPLATIQAAVKLREGRSYSVSEALEVVTREWLESEGDDVSEVFEPVDTPDE